MDPLGAALDVPGARSHSIFCRVTFNATPEGELRTPLDERPQGDDSDTTILIGSLPSTCFRLAFAALSMNRIIGSGISHVKHDWHSSEMRDYRNHIIRSSTVTDALKYRKGSALYLLSLTQRMYMGLLHYTRTHRETHPGRWETWGTADSLQNSNIFLPRAVTKVKDIVLHLLSHDDAAKAGETAERIPSLTIAELDCDNWKVSWLSFSVWLAPETQ